MDKGAHFYKCDFQVHSPRDIQWTGNRFGVNTDQIAELSDEQKEIIINERKQFAKEYLDKAREKGLNSIAITDHHDVVFAKIIRKVAEEENEVFRQQNEPKKCITVFPGIELTLETPICQTIILFDANFPDAHLDSILGILGISPSNEFDKQTAPTVRISSEHINSLPHLYKKLNEVQYCVGRYILLPNVSNSGTSTLLRTGAHSHYKKMPCVGGYVDKALPSDTGWLNKVNGGDVNYGNKPIGVISTSDNRYEDGRELGNYFTWIKWSEPSAEALRQACLAKESRISQNNPELPQIYISKIDVTNSKFLSSFAIDFNQQYNSFIGGRGTGKSTVLEYLRWALCDQTVSSSDLDDLGEIEKRRKNLIDKTLAQFEGEVRVTFLLNGVNHIVKRDSASYEITLKIGDAEFQKATKDEIRRILPIQAYSQKQLSSVGVTGEELKRFIQSPILTEIGSLNFELQDLVERTRSSYLNLIRKKNIEKEIEQFRLEIASLTDQVQNLRRSLTGISAEDQAVIERKPIFDNEGSFVSGIQRELTNINLKIGELETSITNLPSIFPESGSYENNELLNKIQTARAAKITEIRELVTQLKGTLTPPNNNALETLIQEWMQLKAFFDALYEEAKSKATSSQQQLQEIQRIEERLRTIQQAIIERGEILRQLGEPQTEFDRLRTSYWAIHVKKAELLNEQAVKFQQLSNGQIKVNVLKNIDTDPIKREITRLLQGARLQGDKIQSIAANIASNENPLDQWKAIVAEFQALAEFDFRSENPQTLPSTPKLATMPLNLGNLHNISETLTTDNWLILATLSLEFKPEFKYATNNEMGDEIPFSDASAGQQATALLTVLLNQPGAPLIIDQPEDDIDNRAIDSIIKNIWEAKKHRQLVFTSHNANLVVNGDAELVVCFDYRDSGSQTRGIIKAAGAIDSRSVKQEITAVMEGGEKAFKLRKDKYGF
jgi:chromosome segregation protein